MRIARLSVVAVAAGCILAAAATAGVRTPITFTANGNTPLPMSVANALLTSMPDGVAQVELTKLPRGYLFSRWARSRSYVSGHTGADTVIFFKHGSTPVAAEWTITPITKSANCRTTIAGNGAAVTTLTNRDKVAETVYYLNGNHGQQAWTCNDDVLSPTESGRRVYALWDDHELSRAQLVQIVADQRLLFQAESAGFSTPSGNINCFADWDTPQATSEITCDILSGLLPKPAKPKSCQYVFGLTVNLGSTGATDACSTNPVPKAAPLAYNSSFSFFGITCVSKFAGLRCRNQAGHGFFLSRQRSFRF